MAKAARCYDGDASWLLDVCRARIVFESLTDLESCLRVVLLPSAGARIRRIRNSMRPGSEGALASGFRAIVINLCIDNKLSRFLGVENHVCELQLCMRGFAVEELITDEVLLQFRVLRSLHRQLKPIQSLWHFLQLTASKKSSVAVSTDDLDGPQRSGYSANIEACQVYGCSQQEISPDEARKIYCPALDDNFAGKLEGMDAFRSPAMEQCKQALYGVCLRSTLFAGGTLDFQASQVFNAVRYSSAASVWFTSKPFTAAVTKRPFQAIFIVLSCIFAIQTWLALSSWNQGGYFVTSLLKLEFSELRRSEIPKEKSQVADFGLIQDGCKMNISYASAGGFVGSAVILNFGEQMRANGYFFQATNDSVDNDPVKWTVQASTDNGSSWQIVGASVWRYTTDGDVLFYPQLAFDTPIGRGVHIIIDHRLPWQWCMASVVRGIVLFSGNVLTLCHALSGREESSKTSWIAMFSVLGLCFVVSALGYNWKGRWREATEKWIFVPECFVIPIGLAFFESKIIAVLFLFSIVGVSCSLLADCIVYGQDGKCFFINAFQNIYIFIFTMAFVFLVSLFNYRILKKARTLVLEDKVVYDTLWTKITQDPQALSDLQVLRGLIQSIQKNEIGIGFGISADPRQYHAYCLTGRDNILLQMKSSSFFRRLKRAASVAGMSMEMHHSQEINSRIDSLDQLFAQANGLHPLLIHKTKEWALKCDGCVLTTCRKVGRVHKQYSLYSSVQVDHNVCIKWCKVKSLQRSIEKIVRVYGQDVSRLVDICRQSIVFDRVGGIVACMALIAQDKDVRILRIKNKMDPAYNSAQSAGYRDIALNLRVVTPEAQVLGVSAHVCELQLLLRQFAELKSDKGHRRYVNFRDLRGE